MEEVKVYKTSDGVFFEFKSEAITHESSITFKRTLESLEAHWI